MTLASRAAGATKNRPSTGDLHPHDLPGRLIVLEGPEGTGKTTLSRALVERLSLMGVKATALREPGGHPDAEAMRDILKGSMAKGGKTSRGLFGFSAARAMLVEDILIPMLERGEWIILDRWTPSTYVYQAEEGVSRADIDWAVKLSTKGLRPDRVYLLTAEPEVILSRTTRRNDVTDAREAGLSLAKIAERLQNYRTVCAEMGAVEVDTSNRTVDQLAELFLDDLWQLHAGPARQARKERPLAR